MWRVKKLVDAGHLGKDFNVSYAAAPSQRWMAWGMLFKCALREPLAVINNYSKGYFEAVNYANNTALRTLWILAYRASAFHLNIFINAS